MHLNEWASYLQYAHYQKDVRCHITALNICNRWFAIKFCHLQIQWTLVIADTLRTVTWSPQYSGVRWKRPGYKCCITALYFVWVKLFFKSGLGHGGKSGCYLWKDPIFKVLPLKNNTLFHTSKVSVLTRVKQYKCSFWEQIKCPQFRNSGSYSHTFLCSFGWGFSSRP